VIRDELALALSGPPNAPSATPIPSSSWFKALTAALAYPPILESQVAVPGGLDARPVSIGRDQDSQILLALERLTGLVLTRSSSIAAAQARFAAQWDDLVARLEQGDGAGND
jgi:hypothetical protein